MVAVAMSAFIVIVLIAFLLEVLILAIRNKRNGESMSKFIRVFFYRTRKGERAFVDAFLLDVATVDRHKGYD